MALLVCFAAAAEEGNLASARTEVWHHQKQVGFSAVCMHLA